MALKAEHYDIVIIGLGPVGSTLANILGQYNITTLILDQSTSAYHLPRAVNFDDEVMRIFQSIGLTEQMSQISEIGGNAHFVDAKDNIILSWMRPQKLSENNFYVGYRFHQPDLEEVLRNGLRRFPAVIKRWGSKVVDVDQNDTNAWVQYVDISSGQKHEVSASYVVGCDGARSLTRNYINSNVEDLGFREAWLVVDLTLKNPEINSSRESFHYCELERSASSAFVGFKRKRWEFRLNPNDITEEITKPKNVWKLLKRWIGPEDAILERATVYTFESLIAKQWRESRILIAGDAAHQTPPFMGQGMCAGIRDVANLGWKFDRIINKNVSDNLLKTYQKERYPHVKEFIELTIQMGKIINKTKTAIVAGNATNTKDGPQSLGQLKPKLGQGFFAGNREQSGKLFPQPRLGGDILLDERIGNRSALILSANFQSQLSKPTIKEIEKVDIVVIVDNTIELNEWFQNTGSHAVLIRPDRYVTGTAASETELKELIHLYKTGVC